MEDDKQKMGIKETIAGRLKAKREECGLSQDKLSAKAGISTRYYQAIETAKKQPSLDIIFKLALAFGCDYTELTSPAWNNWLAQEKRD